MTAEISYIRDPDAISTQVGDDLIALQSQTWTYAEFDAVGSRIWELLAEPRTVSMLVEQLRREFHVDAEQCERYTVAFVDLLVGREFVRVEQAERTMESGAVRS
jgi:hypothetical protein